MTFKHTALGAAAIAHCLASPVAAQDMAAYEAANDTAIATWRAMPLTFLTVLFTTEPAVGFGLYQPREGSTFAPNEPLVVYAEPMGFGWQENPDGTYSFGVLVDLILRNPEGEILATQDEFQRFVVTSRHRNREFFLSITLDLTNAPAGDYVLEYRVHDLVEDQSAPITLPFTVAAE